MRSQDQPLSPRELHVVRLVVEGRSSQEIAADLLVTVNTVKTHLKNIFRKCDVHSRGELVAWWFRRFQHAGPAAVSMPVRGQRGSHSTISRMVSRAALVAITSALALLPLGATASTTPSVEAIVGVRLGRTKILDGSLDYVQSVASCSPTAAPYGRSSTGCGPGLATTQEFPTIEILSPGEGDNVQGPNVKVTVEVSGFSLVPPGGSSPAAGQGHIIYYLDHEPDFVPGESAIPEDPEVAFGATESTTHVFEGVGPGPHQALVLLVNSDNSPVVPPAVFQVAFVVIGGDETPVPKPSPMATEVGRTVTLDDEVVSDDGETAVLPAALPVVGNKTGSERDGARGIGWASLIPFGAGLVVLGAAGLVVRQLRRRSD